MSNTHQTIEPTFVEGRREPGYVLYEWGIYESWSVLAGQERKSARDYAETVQELAQRYPDAEIHDSKVDAGNSVAHLPGEEWDDALQEWRW